MQSMPAPECVFVPRIEGERIEAPEGGSAGRKGGYPSGRRCHGPTIAQLFYFVKVGICLRVVAARTAPGSQDRGGGAAILGYEDQSCTRLAHRI
jgi:hypothetical protein